MLTLSEIVERTDLPKATVYRLAGQLVDLRYLQRSGIKYRLGSHLFELGNLAVQYGQLRNLAVPYLCDLLDDTQETVHLAVLDGTDAVYLERLNRRHLASFVPSTSVGARRPLYHSGLGKAMLAFSKPGVLRAVADGGLQAVTPYTIDGEDALVEELSSIVSAGVAFDRRECSVGIVCVAAPLLNRRGDAIAAISASGPVGRFEPERYAERVRVIATALNRSISMLPIRRPVPL